MGKMMAELDDIIRELEVTLDRLIANAEQMRESVKQVIEKNELQLLQDTQQDLLRQLKVLDEKYQKKKTSMRTKKEPLSINRITEKLHYFEKLNTSFMHHLKTSFDVIHFNTRKKKK